MYRVTGAIRFQSKAEWKQKQQTKQIMLSQSTCCKVWLIWSQKTDNLKKKVIPQHVWLKCIQLYIKYVICVCFFRRSKKLLRETSFLTFPNWVSKSPILMRLNKMTLWSWESSRWSMAEHVQQPEDFQQCVRQASSYLSHGS